MLFLDASNKTLLKRYKESRRIHPLAMEGRVEEGIERERKILEETKNSADYVIDTSKLLTRELREELENIFVQNKREEGDLWENPGTISATVPIRFFQMPSSKAGEK